MHAVPPVRNNSRHRTRFASHAERAQFLHSFVDNYNRTRLRCLAYKAPLEIHANQTGDNTMGAGRRGATVPVAQALLQRASISADG